MKEAIFSQYLCRAAVILQLYISDTPIIFIYHKTYHIQGHSYESSNISSVFTQLICVSNSKPSFNDPPYRC
jgi:hypothetical protein